MAKTEFFAKGKESFLKKLFGAAIILLGVFVLVWAKSKVSAEDDINTAELNFMNDMGIDPAPLGDYGNWKVTTRYNPDGTIVDTTENEYDTSGNLIKCTIYDSDGNVDTIEEYEASGNLSKVTGYNPNGTLRLIFEYDTNGKHIKSTYYDSEGGVTGTAEKEYDKNGNTIRETYYNPDGTVSFGFIYENKYDTQGRLVKITSYSSDGALSDIIEKEYDTSGSLVRQTRYNSDETISYIIKVEYDTNGNLIRETKYNSDETVSYIMEYKYDENGNEIEGSIPVGGVLAGVKRTSEYKYDDTGKSVTQKITWYTAEGEVAIASGEKLIIEKKWTWFGPVDERPISNNDKVTDKISALPDDGTITVDYSDNAEVPADVFTAIAGTNKDVTFTSEGISWEFSGSDIDASAAKKIDLSTTITMISKQDRNTASAIENLFGQERNALVLKFADNGKLPGKAKIRINADEALKQYLGTTGLEVFYWDNENNTLVPIASKVSIDDNDQIVFEIDHCSYYVVKGRETTKEDKHIPEDVNKDVPEGYEMLFRLYNPNSGEHFYTKSKKEGNSLIDLGWNYEGEGWTAPISGTPVYRLYNKNAGDHHYTTSKREKNNLVAAGWEYEGIGWYSETAENGKPLYRLYNPNATGAGSHHYTTSTRERDSLIKQGWNDEDIAWYGLKK